MNLQQIQEALSKIQEKDALSLTHYSHDITNTNPQHTTIHPDWIERRKLFLEKHPVARDMFAKGGEKRDWQIRFPVEMYGAVGSPNTMVIKTLMAAGGKPNYDKYRDGLIDVKTKIGDASRGIPESEKIVTFAIGKFLRKIKAPEAVIHAYENDPYRANQDGKYDLIITGHPIDIYGGSTGRGWTSCMDVGDKEFSEDDDEENKFSPRLAAKHLQTDVQDQHHMVYLVPRGGDIDKNAIARTSFKLHTSITGKNGALLPEGRIYGTAPPDFLKEAKAKMEELFQVEEGMYVLSHTFYADSPRLKTIGDVKFNVSAMDKISREFEDIENNFDDYEDIYDAKASFIHNIAHSINQMNRHDAMLILMKSISNCDNLIHGHFRHSSNDPNEDLGALLTIHETIFEELEDPIGSDFDEALLNSIDADIVNESFMQTEKFRELFEELVSKAIDDDTCDLEDTIEHVQNCQALQLDIVFKRGDPTSLYRFMLLASKINSLELRMQSKIDTKLVFKRHFAGQTSSKIIATLFESMVFGMNENEDWDDLAEIILNFKDLVQSMISVKYKTLDLFRIIEEDFGDKDLDCDVDEMRTAKEWFEYAIVEVISGTSRSGAHLKLRDGGIVFLGNDEKNLKTVVDLIKTNCSEQTTIARIAELIQSEHFDMIKELGAGVYQKVERKEEPKAIPKEEPKVEPTPAPTQSSAQKLAKYRNPETGATWSGRGLKPKWVYDWLDANPGKTIQDLET